MNDQLNFEIVKKEQQLKAVEEVLEDLERRADDPTDMLEMAARNLYMLHEEKNRLEAELAFLHAAFR